MSNIIEFPQPKPPEEEENTGDLTRGWTITFHYKEDSLDSSYLFSTPEEAAIYAQACSAAHYIATKQMLDWGVYEVEGEPFDGRQQEEEDRKQQELGDGGAGSTDAPNDSHPPGGEDKGTDDGGGGSEADDAR